MYMALLVKPLAGVELTSQDKFGICFMLQMFVTGFITVILKPMKGPDVALGHDDLLHCICATLYVVDHFFIYELLLNVPLDGGWLWNDPALRWSRVPYGPLMMFFSGVCGLCQFLRVEKDRYSKLLHTKAIVPILGKRAPSHPSFAYVIKCGFAATENLLLLTFLFGMSDGLEH